MMAQVIQTVQPTFVVAVARNGGAAAEGKALLPPCCKSHVVRACLVWATKL